jgi:ribonuclease P protein component
VKATVIVSTKVSKKAVDRNRIKRVIRDVLKDEVKTLKLLNYAIIVKKQAVNVPNPELRETFKMALEKFRNIE